MRLETMNDLTSSVFTPSLNTLKIAVELGQESYDNFRKH